MEFADVTTTTTTTITTIITTTRTTRGRNGDHRMDGLTSTRMNEKLCFLGSTIGYVVNRRTRGKLPSLLRKGFPILISTLAGTWLVAAANEKSIWG